MGSSLTRKLAGAAVAAILLAACGGSGGVPNGPSSLAVPQDRVGQEAAAVALSGEYGGKFHSSITGTSKVQLILSQSKSALGGVVINQGSGSSGGLAAIIAWNVNGNKISGNGVGPASSGSGLCTYSMSGTYKHRHINGTFSATYGCSGQSGTFTLRHLCYFQGTGSEAIRPEGGAKPC